ncbi:MAG: hypothetical protein A3F74_24230 [Betaproteobacteria bacterium RIFCSPLOWO2_12_FULL_62_58]|nr:MAG: hypothetical protein A3F74_24230 [Betaproteobacteria bacterium RIFCSPLOWO2_12_FULL_62_58]
MAVAQALAFDEHPQFISVAEEVELGVCHCHDGRRRLGLPLRQGETSTPKPLQLLEGHPGWAHLSVFPAVQRCEGDAEQLGQSLLRQTESFSKAPNFFGRHLLVRVE